MVWPIVAARIWYLFCNWDEIWLKSCDFSSCTRSFVLALDIRRIAKIQSLCTITAPKHPLKGRIWTPKVWPKNMVIWSFGMGKNSLKVWQWEKNIHLKKPLVVFPLPANTTRPLSLNILHGLYSEMIQQRWGGVHDLVCCWKNWSDIQWVGISYNIYVVYIYIYIILYFTLSYTVMWILQMRSEALTFMGFHLQVLMIQLGCAACVQIIQACTLHTYHYIYIYIQYHNDMYGN